MITNGMDRDLSWLLELLRQRGEDQDDAERAAAQHPLDPVGARRVPGAALGEHDARRRCPWRRSRCRGSAPSPRCVELVEDDLDERRLGRGAWRSAGSRAPPARRSTCSRVGGETSWRPLSTFETVEIDTPASFGDLGQGDSAPFPPLHACPQHTARLPVTALITRDPRVDPSRSRDLSVTARSNFRQRCRNFSKGRTMKTARMVSPCRGRLRGARPRADPGGVRRRQLSAKRLRRVPRPRLRRRGATRSRSRSSPPSTRPRRSRRSSTPSPAPTTSRSCRRSSAPRRPRTSSSTGAAAASSRSSRPAC